jgi:hypothetical protein
VGSIQRVFAARGELGVELGNPVAMPEALALFERASPATSLTGIGQSDIEERADGASILITLSHAEQETSEERTEQ